MDPLKWTGARQGLGTTGADGSENSRLLWTHLQDISQVSSASVSLQMTGGH